MISATDWQDGIQAIETHYKKNFSASDILKIENMLKRTMGIRDVEWSSVVASAKSLKRFPTPKTLMESLNWIRKQAGGPLRPVSSVKCPVGCDQGWLMCDRTEPYIHRVAVPCTCENVPIYGREIMNYRQRIQAGHARLEDFTNRHRQRLAKPAPRTAPRISPQPALEKDCPF